MVNRGWTPAGQDRAELPEIKVSSRESGVEGVLSQPPGQLMRLGNPVESSKSWPKRVQNIDLALIEKDTGLRLQPYVLHLKASSEQAYFQDWTPYVDTPQKNQSYAIQWFSMAVVLLLIYISLNTRRLRKSAPQKDEE
jgi:surfeit locus 1 family protein